MFCPQAFGGSMKKLFAISALLFALFLPVLAQAQRQLSADDQRRFDCYYSRWQEYRHTNNREQIVSMEKRMQDVYARYGIPAGTPYWRVASNARGEWDRDNNEWWRWRNRWHGRLSADDQSRFDSYYSRWQEYRRTNNRDEAASMEKRMRDVYSHYGIPSDTPYWQVASNAHSDEDADWDDRDRSWDRDHDRDRGRDGDHDRGLHRGWDKHGRDRDDDDDRDSGRSRRRLSASDQSHFDSYYTRWLQYRRDNNREQISSMEKRMWDVMDHNNIPRDVPFSEIASRQ